MIPYWGAVLGAIVFATPVWILFFWRERHWKKELERADRELYVAAGMLSTTGDWADKHPEEALAFIKKSAQEIDDDPEVR